MFSFLGKDDAVVVRLAKDDKQQYDHEHGTGDVLAYGAVMRGYVHVTDEILRDGARCADLIREGLAFAGSLKPK